MPRRSLRAFIAAKFFVAGRNISDDRLAALIHSTCSTRTNWEPPHLSLR